MQLSFALKDLVAARSLTSLALALGDVRSRKLLVAKPYVEFDFARAAECRDVTPPERLEQYPHQRLIELSLPVSVRFRGVAAEDVEELDIEINGAAAGLRVFDFAPDTQLASDVEADDRNDDHREKGPLARWLAGRNDSRAGGRCGGARHAVDQRGHFARRNGHRKTEPPAAEVRGRRQRHVVGRAGSVFQAEAVVADVARRRARAGRDVCRAGRLAGGQGGGRLQCAGQPQSVLDGQAGDAGPGGERSGALHGGQHGVRAAIRYQVAKPAIDPPRRGVADGGIHHRDGRTRWCMPSENED